MSVNSIFAWVGSYLGSYLLAPDEEPLRSLVSYKGSFGQNAMPLRRHAPHPSGTSARTNRLAAPEPCPEMPTQCRLP